LSRFSFLKSEKQSARKYYQIIIIMPDLDRDSFNKRLKRLYTHWQNSKNENENMDAICLVAGADSESSYYKTTAIQVITYI